MGDGITITPLCELLGGRLTPGNILSIASAFVDDTTSLRIISEQESGTDSDSAQQVQVASIADSIGASDPSILQSDTSFQARTDSRSPDAQPTRADEAAREQVDPFAPKSELDDSDPFASLKRLGEEAN